MLNQCATPGLGSIMAGRRVAGLGQLLLAVAGFVLVVVWFILVGLQTYQQLVNDVPAQSVARVGLAGAALFVAAWLWSLVTSLSLLRAARTKSPSPLPPVHP